MYSTWVPLLPKRFTSCSKYTQVPKDTQVPIFSCSRLRSELLQPKIVEPSTRDSRSNFKVTNLSVLRRGGGKSLRLKQSKVLLSLLLHRKFFKRDLSLPPELPLPLPRGCCP